MQPMKVRLILMGCIISVLGIILLVARGYSIELLGVLLVGLILVGIGLVWRKPKSADRVQRESH